MQEDKSLYCRRDADRAMLLVPCKATVLQRHVMQCPVAGKPHEAPHKESDMTLQTAEGQLASKQSVIRDASREGKMQLPALPPMPAGVSLWSGVDITITTYRR